MSFGLDNPRKRGDDVQIRTAFDLFIVKPVSAKGREWFKKNTGSVQSQLMVGAITETLADSFARLNLQVIWNPPSGTSEVRKIVSERLARWRNKQ